MVIVFLVIFFACSANCSVGDEIRDWFLNLLEDGEELLVELLESIVIPTNIKKIHQDDLLDAVKNFNRLVNRDNDGRLDLLMKQLATFLPKAESLVDRLNSLIPSSIQGLEKFMSRHGGMISGVLQDLANDVLGSFLGEVGGVVNKKMDGGDSQSTSLVGRVMEEANGVINNGMGQLDDIVNRLTRYGDEKAERVLEFGNNFTAIVEKDLKLALDSIQGVTSDIHKLKNEMMTEIWEIVDSVTCTASKVVSDVDVLVTRTRMKILNDQFGTSCFSQYGYGNEVLSTINAFKLYQVQKCLLVSHISETSDLTEVYFQYSSLKSVIQKFLCLDSLSGRIRIALHDEGEFTETVLSTTAFFDSNSTDRLLLYETPNLNPTDDSTDVGDLVNTGGELVESVNSVVGFINNHLWWVLFLIFFVLCLILCCCLCGICCIGVCFIGLFFSLFGTISTPIAFVASFFSCCQKIRGNNKKYDKLENKMDSYIIGEGFGRSEKQQQQQQQHRTTTTTTTTTTDLLINKSNYSPEDSGDEYKDEDEPLKHDNTTTTTTKNRYSSEIKMNEGESDTFYMSEDIKQLSKIESNNNNRKPLIRNKSQSQSQSPPTINIVSKEKKEEETYFDSSSGEELEDFENSSNPNENPEIIEYPTSSTQSQSQSQSENVSPINTNIPKKEFVEPKKSPPPPPTRKHSSEKRENPKPFKPFKKPPPPPSCSMNNSSSSSPSPGLLTAGGKTTENRDKPKFKAAPPPIPSTRKPESKPFPHVQEEVKSTILFKKKNPPPPVIPRERNYNYNSTTTTTPPPIPKSRGYKD